MRLVSATCIAVLALVLAAGSSHGAGGGAISGEREGTSTTATAPAETSTSAADAKLDGCVGENDGQLVRIKVAGTHLDGVAIGNGPVGVVLAHERGRNLCDWLP